MDTRQDFIIFIQKIGNKDDDLRAVKKNPHDKLLCSICEGQYSRNKQALHFGTKKHKLAQAKKFRVFKDTFILDYD